jgi:hypothetical protein
MAFPGGVGQHQPAPGVSPRRRKRFALGWRGRYGPRPGRAALSCGEAGSSGRWEGACRRSVAQAGSPPGRGRRPAGRRRGQRAGPWRRCTGRNRQGGGTSARTAPGGSRDRTGRTGSSPGPRRPPRCRPPDSCAAVWGSSKDIRTALPAGPRPSASRQQHHGRFRVRGARRAGARRGPCRRACWRRGTPPD